MGTTDPNPPYGRSSRAAPTPKAATLSKGNVVGTYRVRQRLGEGGMGVVYLAHDEALDRPVAIKLLNAATARADFVTALRAEARAMARIRHENVVAVYAFGHYREAPYLAMEFVPGPDLAAWLERAEDLGIEQTLAILEQVAAGVDAIHAAGVAHHDLKPENILVGPNLRIAITDLGLARLANRDAYLQALGGTPAYMAPELLRGDKISEADARKADIFSVGVLAYELLTGRLPFAGETYVQIAAEHERGDVLEPSAACHGLGTAFDGPIMRALSTDAGARPESAAEFVQSLVAARRASEAPARGGVRILLADDDRTFRRIAQGALTQRFPDASIVCVGDGQEALDVLDEQGADVALVDLNMPGLNGLELTAVIRSTESLKSTRIIVATAVGGATDWRVLSSLGVDALMLKPVRVPELVQTFERLLGVQ